MDCCAKDLDCSKGLDEGHLLKAGVVLEFNATYLPQSMSQLRIRRFYVLLYISWFFLFVLRLFQCPPSRESVYHRRAEAPILAWTQMDEGTLFDNVG